MKTVDTLGWIIVGFWPAYSVGFLAVFLAPTPHLIPPLDPNDNPECFQTFPNVPWGAKSTPQVEKHCFERISSNLFMGPGGFSIPLKLCSWEGHPSG